ncbi:MAG TPA: DUF1329 domain-containing protein [Candidatus Bathyarchaeia archaeon]|nr:DUF1329 domain-containing protein [Candidatus Bathyarchaeia archaeon]
MFKYSGCIRTAICFLLINFSPAAANDGDLKPGDTIGPENWEKAKGMVGENLLNRIKQGYTLRIKPGRSIGVPKEFNVATTRYSDQVKLESNGELLNYIAGLPFPNVHLDDPQIGLKMAWNFYWRWVGDDYKTGGGTGGGKIIRYAIEKDGSERRAEVLHHTIKTRGRVTLDSKPRLDGYEHIDWMQLRADEYPRDTAGTTTLEIRYADAKREDDLYIYVPSIRRVRRAPPIQRCATIAPSEFNFDDINSFGGKITDFNYRFLGRSRMLGNFAQEQVPFYRKIGDYLPLKESWEIVETYGLEITPKDPNYCYPRKVIYFDTQSFETFWTMIWDAKGNYWKEQFALRSPVTLTDGQLALSVGTVVIINVQNGRSTLVDAVRNYNQGYQPSLFTLATLQTVMRGGAIR